LGLGKKMSIEPFVYSATQTWNMSCIWVPVVGDSLRTCVFNLDTFVSGTVLAAVLLTLSKKEKNNWPPKL
jgi:hypothetical protein